MLIVLRKESAYYVPDTMGYGSRVGYRTGQKIAEKQDTKPNMAECSYLGTVRFSYSKPSSISKSDGQTRAKMSELQLQRLNSVDLN